MFHARGGGAGFPRDIWVEQVRCEGRGSEDRKEQTRAFRSHGKQEREQRQAEGREFHLECVTSEVCSVYPKLHNRSPQNLVV